MSVQEELAAELAADDRRGQQGQQCKTCAWLRTRPDEEREAWNAHFADESFTTNQLVRAIIERRKGGMGESSLRDHRKAGHQA